MRVGSRVEFFRPGSTGDSVRWRGMIEDVQGESYLIRCDEKLRVVPVTEKWLKEEQDAEPGTDRSPLETGES